MVKILAELVAARGVKILDLREKLVTHPTKRFAQRNPKKIRGMCIHHSAGRSGGIERLLGHAEYHTGPSHISETGAPGICYTLGIIDDGTLCILNPLENVTWSQGTAQGNIDMMAVELVGNFKSETNPDGIEPTPEQINTVIALYLTCLKLWGTRFQIAGHYHYTKPACPGDTMMAVIEAIRSHARIAEVSSVYDIQQALKDLGYPVGEVDGLYGQLTRAAVSAFQDDSGLYRDGIAGPITCALLLKALEDRL